MVGETTGKPARERGEKVKRPTGFDLQAQWRSLLKIEDSLAWASEFSCDIPAFALLDLDRAFKNFVSGKAQHPRFKSRDKSRWVFRVRGAIRRDDTSIMIPKMGRLRIKGLTRRMPSVAAIKQASISRTADRWFVSFLVSMQVEQPEVRVPASPEEVVGVDAGLRNSLTLSTGEVIQGPRAFTTHAKKLARYQRVLARCRRGSGRRKAAAMRVARQHKRVADVRRTWQHEVSSDLVNRFAVIGHEDLNVKGLANKKNHNGRAWADLGIAELFRQIDYKAAWHGGTVVVADRFYPSSKLCSNCGEKNADLKRSDIVFLCPSCGFRLDRDLNAAFNLRPVAVIPPETLTARGGMDQAQVWMIPLRREPVSATQSS